MDNWIDRARKKRELDHEPKYGIIQPKTDKRCFRKEMIEELLDGLNYCEWAKVKGEIDYRQFKELDKGVRRVIQTLQKACLDRWEWELSWGR